MRNDNTFASLLTRLKQPHNISNANLEREASQCNKQLLKKQGN